jgi:predicted nucleic acid-binding protein
MILDTNFLIDILQNKKIAIKKLKELKKKKEPLLLPPGALYELYLGAESEEQIKRIENELNRAELTPNTEKEAAKIRKNLTSQGKPISSIDYLIAGKAREINEKILTNDQHFNRINQVKIENY